MQKNLNLKVKFRESFRPFAPAVLRDDVSDWFELDSDSPYMLIVADVRRDKRRAMTPSEDALFGIDKLNVVRSKIPRRAASPADRAGRARWYRPGCCARPPFSGALRRTAGRI